MSSLYIIPKSWKWATLEEITDTTSGGTPKRTNKDYWNGSINWLKSGELNDGYINAVQETITEEGLKKSSAKVFEAGTLLMAMYGATVGRLGILKVDTSTNQAVCAIFNRFNLFNNEYVFFYLKYTRQQMLEDSFGGAQPNLSQGYINNITIPFAPLNEQKKIVTKIEKIFSNLDNSDKYLIHLEKQLKRYRQSVLKSAFEGKLTREWREKQTNLESSLELLEKIKIERIEYIDLEVRKKFKDKTEKWITEKVKKEVDKFYNNLKPINNEEKPFTIPNKWSWVRLNELSKKITDGTHHSPVNLPIGEFKYITAKHIKNNEIIFKDLTYVTEKVHNEIYSRCNPEYGDLLLIKDGATTGVCTINTLEEEFSMLSSVALIKNFSNINSKFILNFLKSSVLNTLIRRDMKGVGITRITLTQLKSFIFPTCSLLEQIEIVKEIEKHTSIINKLETVVQKSVKESKRLRQSILKQAFEGKLVEQDSYDESAEILLEKIAKAKEEYKKALKRNKK